MRSALTVGARGTLGREVPNEYEEGVSSAVFAEIAVGETDGRVDPGAAVGRRISALTRV
jgi:hypothetical protein